jgi:hypothetical protein
MVGSTPGRLDGPVRHATRPQLSWPDVIDHVLGSYERTKRARQLVEMVCFYVACVTITAIHIQQRGIGWILGALAVLHRLRAAWRDRSPRRSGRAE